VDKKLKTKWVAALRSGKYKQGRSQLKQTRNTDNGDPVTTFCCLGVLKDIHPGIRARDYGFYLSCNQSGIDADIQDKLAEFNDGCGLTKPWGFRRIATWIEKNL
jgi:hypothetical protein